MKTIGGRIRSRGVAWLLAIAACLALAGEARAIEFFRAEEGRFHVLLPERPSVHRKSRRTLLGRVTHQRYEVAAEGASWAVEIHDIPRGATFLLSPEKILNRARKGFLEDERRTELERTEVVRRGHPAQRIRYLRAGGLEAPCEALLVLVGSRIYIAIGEDTAPARKVLPPGRFLSSFDFWEEGARGFPPARHRAPVAAPRPDAGASPG